MILPLQEMIDTAAQPYVDGADYDSSTYWGAEKTFAEAFAASLDKAVSTIHSKSCTDRIKELFPSVTEKVEGVYDTLYNKLNVGYALQLIGENTPFLSYGEGDFSICVTFSMWWRYIRFYLDSILKTALVMFKKIDKARELIEESMIDLIYAIKNCII